ncbi:ribonuclease HII [Ktedonobacter racemifer]|uniref:Ribonuclease HII n=1 Tax=Ktedonobacter racemifer DSM 44963 TaxID=485913 RepID=D6TME8_KTERA|nr:ribonuclease HII [Ktedonobacter racemifer]EFH86948.1 Ribonuclease H [Ktedonobacter racemifer DSM 44963]
MQKTKKSSPTLTEEMALFEQGYCFIAGLDEAGRGCLAGPVVAAAVILPLESNPTPVLARFTGVNDSKQLNEATRERLYDVIMEHALAVGVGIGSVELIDQRNILQATLQSMRVALTQLTPTAQALLLDAVRLRDIPLPQLSLTKGDSRCLSIAAASIIAKVTRDRLMHQLHEEFPRYGFKQHKGYGTPEHLEALKQFGVTPHHRRSFSPIREMLFGLFPDTAF